VTARKSNGIILKRKRKNNLMTHCLQKERNEILCEHKSLSFSSVFYLLSVRIADNNLSNCVQSQQSQLVLSTQVSSLQRDGSQSQTSWGPSLILLSRQVFFSRGWGVSPGRFNDKCPTLL
jgi:hypothetical protein